MRVGACGAIAIASARAYACACACVRAHALAADPLAPSTDAAASQLQYYHSDPDSIAAAMSTVRARFAADL